MQAIGLDIDRNQLRYRCEDRPVAWQLLTAACGIGVAHLSQGASVPDLVRLLPRFPARRLTVRLASHRELKTNRRVRRTFDFNTEVLSAELQVQSD